MNITASLTAINSKVDIYGNCYWAFRFVDYDTGKNVCAKISGGESNIAAIRQYWNNPDGWDNSVTFSVDELPIRKFNSFTKDWSYAGCHPQELADFIRKSLAQD